MTGDSDYLLRVVVDSRACTEDLIRRRLHDIPGVAAIDTSFALWSREAGPGVSGTPLAARRAGVSANAFEPRRIS